MKIGIIDYGVGNITSIVNSFNYIEKDIDIDLVKDADKLKQYDKIVLPGVGAFGQAIDLIRTNFFDKAIIEESKKGKFILGICLGMQLLGSKSYEKGEWEGLNLIEGEVIPFPQNLKVPHIGWNDIIKDREDKLLENIENGSDFYFVHSYYFKCKYNTHQLASTLYGDRFSSIINKDNVYGVQFHPEKSQKNGLLLISNFLKL